MGRMLIEDLPQPLVDKAIRSLDRYTIGFLRIDNSGGPHQLLGSGVLVSVGDTRAILTAHHVIEVLPETARLSILLEGNKSQPPTIPRLGVEFLKIARGTQDSVGPDLGAVILSRLVAGSIGSIKSFYNLNRWRDELLHGPPDLDEGFWIAQGFLEEKTVVLPHPDGHGSLVRFYNFNGIGSPEIVGEAGGYDYLDYPVSPVAERTPPPPPQSWGGMSGGGLWQIPFYRQGNTMDFQSVFLSGIMFYERAADGRIQRIRCHGRRSVYERALNAIQEFMDK